VGHLESLSSLENGSRFKVAYVAIGFDFFFGYEGKAVGEMLCFSSSFQA